MTAECRSALAPDQWIKQTPTKLCYPTPRANNLITLFMKWLIRYFFKGVRAILGPIILLVDKLTSPRGIQRSAEQQQQVDQQTRQLALYQFRGCPFCIKVRRAAKRLSLNIEKRDALADPVHRSALLEGGGQIKVPCLRISGEDGQERWLYESGDIIAYLQSRFN